MTFKVFADVSLFVNERWQNKAAVSMPFTCSQQTALFITKMIEDRSVDKTTAGHCILETGAGTGVVIEVIVKKMNDRDRLIVIGYGKGSYIKKI
jgi:phospholipid N-methyltransferase